MFFYNNYSYDTLDDIQERINATEKILVDDKDSVEECGICLEKYYGLTNDKTYNIDYIIANNYNVIKPCNCEYIVHKECFNEWFNRNASCIICRKKMHDVIIIINNHGRNVSHYLIVRITVKLINGILIANYTIYLFKKIYRVVVTVFLYSILMYYLVNIIKKQYILNNTNIDIEYETLGQ
jgi:hypothetical protein